MPPFAIGLPGPTEMLIILFLLMFVFGAGKLPDVARNLGSALGSLKRGARELEDLEDEFAEEARQLAPPKRASGNTTSSKRSRQHAGRL